MAEIKDIKLGNRLSYLRKRKKMTLDELALKSGVSKSILSQIERDLSNPTVSTISRISQALEENLSDLFSKIEVEGINKISCLYLSCQTIRYQHHQDVVLPFFHDGSQHE